jgi:hypothetical protein
MAWFSSVVRVYVLLFCNILTCACLQEYLSLSETACSLFNEQAWEGGGGGPGLGGGEL